jgi:hypothetical protein
MLGVGTGNTGRRTMGFVPMASAAFQDCIGMVKGLLRCGRARVVVVAAMLRPSQFDILVAAQWAASN